MAALAGSANTAPPWPVEPTEGILLLRSGGELAGKITQAGDRYVVVTPSGVETRIRASEVELVCRTLEEAYRLKLAAIQGRRDHEHLDLADWCIRHKLYPQAADELAFARLADAHHPRLKLLEQWLKQATEPVETHRPAARPLATATGSEEADIQLPPGAMETFTRTIQPLLLNLCATSGCHGAPHDPFHLERGSANSMLTRRLTQRNLAAVLGQIDREEPPESPLLKIPRQPHGTSTKPIWGEREGSKSQVVAEWIAQVAGAAPQANPTHVGSPVSPLLQQMPGKAPAASPWPSTAPQNSPTPAAPTGRSRSRPLPPQRGQETSQQAIDPFDPEIFNRQFFPGSSS